MHPTQSEAPPTLADCTSSKIHDTLILAALISHPNFYVLLYTTYIQWFKSSTHVESEIAIILITGRYVITLEGGMEPMFGKNRRLVTNEMNRLRLRFSWLKFIEASGDLQNKIK